MNGLVGNAFTEIVGPDNASNLPGGINANKIADGSVSDAEFEKLDGVTANIQTQIDNKANALGAQTITYAATITPDYSLGRVIRIDYTGNLTIANGTNPVDGAVYLFVLNNSGGGVRTLAFGNKYTFTNLTLSLPIIDGARTILAVVYRASTDTYACEWVQNAGFPSSLRVLATLTANGTVSIPAGYAITNILFRETAGNAVTGGIKIGTSSGGTEVVVAQAVGANGLGSIKDAAILLNYFSFSANTTLYVQAVSAWNSASVNLTFVLEPAP